MSMRIYTVTGIGFILFNGENGKDIVNFIRNHKNSLYNVYQLKTAEEILSAVEEIDLNFDDNEVMNALDEIFDFHTSETIANIINHEQEIIGVCGNNSCGDTDVEENILYEPGYPWQMTEKEKTLSREDIEEILMSYAKELGVNPKTVDELELEYCG